MPRTERTDIAFPFRITSSGRTAVASPDEHVRELIEQLLFTSPGERVMRPSFGSGLADTPFEPNSPELAATLDATLHAAIQRWLGEEIQLEDLEVATDGPVLQVIVRYLVRRTGERHEQVIPGGGAA